MIEVEAPDGTVVEFPDNTPKEVMTSVMAKSFPKPKGPPSVAEDIAKTVPAGLVRGVTGLVGFPGTVQGWIGKGVNEVGEKLGFNRVNLPESSLMPSGEALTKSVEQNVTGPLYQPQTRAGRYANAVAEFAPGAVAPGGVLANLIKYAAITGVASEAAGEAAQSIAPQYEGVARAIGAIVPAVGLAALTRPSTAQAVKNYAKGITPQQVQQAEALFAEAQRMGTPITRAEAVQHVTNGATRFGDLQRVMEGQGQLRGQMAQRVQQNDAAFGNVVDRVQPNPTGAPSNIGPQAQVTAKATVNDVRNTINRASQPYYDASATVRLTPQEMNRFRAIPGYEEARNAVRGDPQLNRYVANLPDDSVGFLNEVKKYFEQQSTNAAGPMNAQRNQQRAAGYGTDASTARTIAETASPDYVTALQIQNTGRERYLQPLLNGPIGKLAQSDQTTQKAINALFPSNPLPNSAQEISQAVTALSRRNPRVANDLVRAHLESTFNEATQSLLGGQNQWGGAKFAASVRGNPQQAANLEAAIRSLPNGDNIWPGVDRFLTMMEAQGQRQRPGSMTSFNNELLQDLRGGGNFEKSAKSLNLTQIPKRLTDSWERWRLGKNLDELSRLLTDPRAAQDFRRLATAPEGGGQAFALATRLTYFGSLASGNAKPKTQ